MSRFCNSNDSTSQYPPFCCVHNGGEQQPLLGHHSHQTPRQNNDVYIDMTNEKAPFVHPTTCSSNCNKSHRKRKFFGKLFGFVFLVYLYHTFVNRNHHHIVIDDGRVEHRQDGSSSSGSGCEIYDYCKKYAIDWDGPSTFVTDAQNFQLRFGKGQHSENVKVVTGDVQQPTLHISGKISPDNNEDHKKFDDLIVSKNQAEIDIERLGLHIEIKESDDLFDAYIWFEDRTAKEEGHEYRACARLEITVTIPESYKNYNSILINGAITFIDLFDLDTIAFNKLDLSTSVGRIVSKGELFVDEFKAHTSTGKTEIESVQVTEGSNKPLNVLVSTNTGPTSLGAKTTLVSGDEAHKVDVTTSTGSVKVDVSPSSSSSNTGNVGALNVLAQSRTGGVDATINLASAEQNLNLVATTNTGSARVTVSDNFLGRFKLETNTGSTHVREASGSESQIKYEKNTSRLKSGVKTLGNDDSKSQIEVKTTTGGSSLQFI